MQSNIRSDPQAHAHCVLDGTKTYPFANDSQPVPANSFGVALQPPMASRGPGVVEARAPALTS
eukprot:6532065-Pyramimonas_sp.AAC.1